MDVIKGTAELQNPSFLGSICSKNEKTKFKEKEMLVDETFARHFMLSITQNYMVRRETQ